MIEPAGPLKLCSSVALAPVDDGYWAYDIQTSKLHHLNPLAALILELSDGSRTATEIAVEVPAALVRAWSQSEKVGMYQVLDNGISQLELAVEKDLILILS